MKRRELSLLEIAVIAGTRGMAGAGLGLLLSDRLPASRRKAIGWSLFLLGAASTIPIARYILFDKYKHAAREPEQIMG